MPRMVEERLLRFDGTKLFAERRPSTAYPTSESIVRVYYEGWVVGSPPTWAEGRAYDEWETAVEQAANRCVLQYPTSAVQAVARESLIRVGTYSVAAQGVRVDDAPALVDWLAGWPTAVCLTGRRDQADPALPNRQ